MDETNLQIGSTYLMMAVLVLVADFSASLDLCQMYKDEEAIGLNW